MDLESEINDLKLRMDSLEEYLRKKYENRGGQFIKPTLAEIRAYCHERKNSVDPEAFYDFYESKGWMIGKNKMKSWKSAINTWERHGKNEKPPAPKTDQAWIEWGKANEMPAKPGESMYEYKHRLMSKYYS